MLTGGGLFELSKAHCGEQILETVDEECSENRDIAEIWQVTWYCSCYR